MRHMFKTHRCALAVCAFLSACATAPKGEYVSPNAQYLPEGYVAIDADYREYETAMNWCEAYGGTVAECEKEISEEVCHAGWPKGYCGRHLRITHFMKNK